MPPGQQPTNFSIHSMAGQRSLYKFLAHGSLRNPSKTLLQIGPHNVEINPCLVEPYQLLVNMINLYSANSKITFNARYAEIPAIDNVMKVLATQYCQRKNESKRQGSHSLETVPTVIPSTTLLPPDNKLLFTTNVIDVLYICDLLGLDDMRERAVSQLISTSSNGVVLCDYAKRLDEIHSVHVQHRTVYDDDCIEYTATNSDGKTCKMPMIGLKSARNFIVSTFCACGWWYDDSVLINKCPAFLLQLLGQEQFITPNVLCRLNRIVGLCNNLRDAMKTSEFQSSRIKVLTSLIFSLTYVNFVHLSDEDFTKAETNQWLRRLYYWDELYAKHTKWRCSLDLMEKLVNDSVPLPAEITESIRKIPPIQFCADLIPSTAVQSIVPVSHGRLNLGLTLTESRHEDGLLLIRLTIMGKRNDSKDHELGKRPPPTEHMQTVHTGSSRFHTKVFLSWLLETNSTSAPKHFSDDIKLDLNTRRDEEWPVIAAVPRLPDMRSIRMNVLLKYATTEYGHDPEQRKVQFDATA